MIFSFLVFSLSSGAFAGNGGLGNIPPAAPIYNDGSIHRALPVNPYQGTPSYREPAYHSQPYSGPRVPSHYSQPQNYYQRSCQPYANSASCSPQSNSGLRIGFGVNLGFGSGNSGGSYSPGIFGGQNMGRFGGLCSGGMGSVYGGGQCGVPGRGAYGQRQRGGLSFNLPSLGGYGIGIGARNNSYGSLCSSRGLCGGTTISPFGRNAWEIDSYTPHPEGFNVSVYPFKENRCHNCNTRPRAIRVPTFRSYAGDRPYESQIRNSIQHSN